MRIQLVILFIVSLGIDSLVSAGCCSGCTQCANATKSYEIVTTFKTNWFRAEHFCLSEGMRLATVLSKDEDDQIDRVIRDSGFHGKYWLGGTNQGNGNTFYWMGLNKALSFSDWHRGQPDSARNNEKCLEIAYYAGDPILNGVKWDGPKWNDIDCLEDNYVICESTCQ